MPDRMQLADIARAYDQLAHGERSDYLDRHAAHYGITRSTLLRQMQRDLGWSSGRKPRSDKGRTKVGDATMRFVAALQREGVRKNGKSTLAVTTAASIAHANGYDIPVVPDTLQRVLRARKLAVAQQTQATPHIGMRAPHPNYLHQVDPSLCVVYYLKGEQKIMREEEFYKNKLEAYAKVKFKTWRYVLWDAASSALKTRYYQAAGETQLNLAEFILWAWSVGERKPPYGVPKHLGLDPGSANTAHAIRALCDALEVEMIVHAPGAARVSGGVESAQNIVERQFESRLRFEPVDSVEALNAAADAWWPAWNANQIPMLDSRLTRNGQRIGARSDLWMTISADELRFLPDLAVCRALMEGRVQERKVMANLRVSFKHPQSDRMTYYSVRDVPGLSVGDLVRVSPLVYGDRAIRVRMQRYDGQEIAMRLAPMAGFDEYGQPIDAPVWGESYKAQPTTALELESRALDALAYPNAKTDEDLRKARAKNTTPLLSADGTPINAHSHLRDVQLATSMPRRGSTIETPDYATVAPAPPMTHFAACRALAKSLGRALSVEESERVQAWYPDGVREADLATLSTCIESGTTPFNAVRKTGTA